MKCHQVLVVAIASLLVLSLPAASWFAGTSNDGSFSGVVAVVDWLEQHSGAISAAATVVIMAFTVTLYWATRQMAVAALQTINEGKVSEQRQFRAYVLVDHTDVSFCIGEVGVFSVVVRNYGATPAYDLTVRVRAVPKDVPLDSLALPSAEEVPIGSRGVLGPGCTTAAAATSNARLDEKTVASVKEDESVIFVVGVIEYEDVFGSRQRTDFRLVWTGPQMRMGATNLQVCPEGNTAT